MQCLQRDCIARAQCEVWHTSSLQQMPHLCNGDFYSTRSVLLTHLPVIQSSPFHCTPVSEIIWHSALIMTFKYYSNKCESHTSQRQKTRICTRCRKGNNSNTEHTGLNSDFVFDVYINVYYVFGILYLYLGYYTCEYVDWLTSQTLHCVLPKMI